MTHVAHPYVQRIGVIRDWKSRWFAADPKKYREYIRTDGGVRKLLARKLKGMHIAGVEIERNEKVFRIIIKSSRPGLIIGRSGEGATKLRKDVAEFGAIQQTSDRLLVTCSAECRLEFNGAGLVGRDVEQQGHLTARH